MIILHEEIELIFLFLPKVFLKKEVLRKEELSYILYIFLHSILLSCIFNNGPPISS